MANKEKLLVTGAGGLLGSALAELAVHGYKVYSAFRVHKPVHGTPILLDLVETSRIPDVVEKLQPDIIIHAAALTNVDLCEEKPELADLINHRATVAMAKAARRVGAYFIYVSTDYVFDGEKGLYREQDEPSPINVYGRTKLLGEQAAHEYAGSHVIARTSVIIGSRPAAGKANFALWVLESLRTGRRIRVVVDQWASPTYNINLARMLLELVERRDEGVYHLAGASRISRLELAARIAEMAGFDKELILPSLSSEMQWKAKRPRDSSLDVTKARNLLKEKPLPIDDAVMSILKSLRIISPQRSS